MGLVVIRPRTEELPWLSEALGVSFEGDTRQDTVDFLPSSLSGDAFYLNSPAGGAILALQNASAEAAALYSKSGGQLAGVLNTWGLGRTVTLPKLTPLGVAAIELRMTNLAQPLTLRAEEQLHPELTALWASQNGSIQEGGRRIVWSGLALDRSSALSMQFLLRVPASVGNYTSSALLTSYRGAPHPLGTWQWELPPLLTPEELAQEARAALKPFDGQPAASTLHALLTAVENRPITQRTDIELNLEDLLTAAQWSRTLSGDSAPVRVALGDLLQYWEARWSLEQGP